MKLKPHEVLWLYSMGKRLRVTAIFTDADAANAYMAHTDDACIAAVGDPENGGEFIFLANKYDYGEKVPLDR